jgi:hypothetical protein
VDFFKDTLVVFAAGNEGSLGTGSVSSPGLGKNFLTVGAARNAFQSFSEVPILHRLAYLATSSAHTYHFDRCSMQAYNTYVNYTYVRELYNREHCLLDCSGAHLLLLFEMLLLELCGAGEAEDHHPDEPDQYYRDRPVLLSKRGRLLQRNRA